MVELESKVVQQGGDQSKPLDDFNTHIHASPDSKRESDVELVVESGSLKVVWDIQRQASDRVNVRKYRCNAENKELVSTEEYHIRAEHSVEQWAKMHVGKAAVCELVSAYEYWQSQN